MKSFIYKAGIALFSVILSHNVNAAANTNGMLDDLQNAASKPATLNFSPMVFDFSSELSTTTSFASAMGQLILAKNMGTLHPVQLPYCVSEIFAAYVRAKPETCADLVAHISDKQNMYKAWGKSLAFVKVADMELSSLASFTTAAPFVSGVIDNDMPVILKQLGVADSKLQEVQMLLKALEPAITPTMCLAYATAAAGAKIAQAIEDFNFSTCCGCFGTSKPSVKLTKAAAIARAGGAESHFNNKIITRE